MTLRPRMRAGLALLATASAVATGCTGGAARPGRPTPAVTARLLPAAQTPSRTSPPRATSLATRKPGRQLITVTTPGSGATYATFNAYTHSAGKWRRVFGPWTARIGRRGFAPPGHKREGDGRTPSGSFGIQFLFGVLPSPGVRFDYRRIRSYDFWDDDPASPRYNEWVDERRANAGANPEPMDVSGYDYGAVIGYNTARTPGLGSGIFLHVNIGIATAGCITLPVRKLLAVLRWLNPARSPQIRMGTT